MKYLFYKPIKVSGSEEEVCFWSDTHFNHACPHWPIPLWKARGFSSIEEHNRVLIQRWNEKSNENTTFFHLGDFLFGMDSKTKFKSIIEQLNFKVLYLMPGNHFSGWNHVFEEQKSNVWDVNSCKRVVFIPNYIEAAFDGQLIVMSHYPILSFNGQSKDAICLYGHVHGNLSKHPIHELYSKAKAYEVTVENTSSPINLQQIKTAFKGRHPVVFDHHT